MSEEFKKRTGGKEPYKWQLDVAEALLLKIDCIAIAGTGAGKNYAFFHAALGRWDREEEGDYSVRAERVAG